MAWETVYPRRDVKIVMKKKLDENIGKKRWYASVYDYKTGDLIVSADSTYIDRCVDERNYHIMELINLEDKN